MESRLFRHVVESPTFKKIVTTTAIVGTVSRLLFAEGASAQTNPSVDKPPVVSPSPTPVFLPGFPARILPLGEATLSQKKQLDKYKLELPLILNDQELVSVFTGIHGLTRSQVVESLDIYYPMYRMAAAENMVEDEAPPWFGYALIHAGETEFSTNSNPGASGYKGGFQRDDELHPNERVRELGQKYRFMLDPRQRYQSEVGTDMSDDVAELFWTAEYIREYSGVLYPERTATQRMRGVLANAYSRDGSYRAALFNQLLEIRKRKNLP